MLHSYLYVLNYLAGLAYNCMYVQLAITFTLNFGVAIAIATCLHPYSPADWDSVEFEYRTIPNTHGS